MNNVYLIYCEDTNTYKIGVAKNVESRLKQLQTGNPAILKIIKVFSTDIAFEVENVLHRIHENVHNEWFILSDSEVDIFLDKCATIEKNIKFIKENSTYGYR